MKKSVGSRVVGLVILLGSLVVLQACGSESAGGPPESSASQIAPLTGETAAVTNAVSHPAKMQVGDVFQSEFDGAQPGVLDLSDANPDSEYLLAVVNMNSDGTAQDVRLTADLSAQSAPTEKNVTTEESWQWNVQEALEDQLRQLEQQTAQLPALRASSGGKATTAPTRRSGPQVGDQERFRVIAGLSTLTRYNEVTARLACIGAHVLWYMDLEIDRVNPRDMPDTDVQAQCASFDRVVAREQEMLGEASDINGDGRVAVLMSPQVNRIGAAGGGVVTGFFLSSDLHSRSSSNPVSNEREMLYLMVPDTGARYGVAISRELALQNLIPAVLPHELQHAISYNQHVLVRGGAPERSWLNEGISHLMEDVLGEGQENPSRYEVYLQNPSAFGLVTPGSPGLAERGGIFLLLRYLFEQYAGDGQQFLRDLVNTSRSGVENLEAAFASKDPTFDRMSEFLLRFSAVLALNGSGVTRDPRYGFAARQWQDTPRFHSGVCTVCDVNDGRATQLSGVLPESLRGSVIAHVSGAAMRFYRVPGGRDSLALSVPAGQIYGAVLIRIR